MHDYTRALAHRAEPPTAWIADVRQRFRVERAIDEVLTRKLRDRGNTAPHQTDLAGLEQRLLRFLRRETGQQGLRVAHLRRLSGGASKEQFTFDLTWQTGGEPATRKMILRMDPSEAIVETHRMREYQMLRAVHTEVPVPEVFWVDAHGENLGHPALVAGFLPGVVRPAGGAGVSGIGMYFPPSARDALKDDFVRILARIHAVDWRKKDLSAFDKPAANSTEATAWTLAMWQRICYEDSLTTHPILEDAACWLNENMTAIERPVIVHGDYRSGNFMFTDDLRINAVLDWELCYLGDHHEDLAWASLDIFGGPDEQGRRLASSLLPVEEMIEKYQRFGGLPVDPVRLGYFTVFSYYKIAVITIATGLRVAHGRKTHLDAMMNLAAALGYAGLGTLNRLVCGARQSKRRGRAVTTATCPEPP